MSSTPQPIPQPDTRPWLPGDPPPGSGPVNASVPAKPFPDDLPQPDDL